MEKENLGTTSTEWEIILKNKADLKNIITELKNTLEEINSKLTNIEVQISKLEDRIVAMNQSKEQKINKNKIKNMRIG